MAALAVPVTALFGFTALELRTLAAEADAVRDQAELARAAVGPSSVIARLQDERSWAGTELSGAEGIIDAPVPDYDESRRLTDVALTEFRAELDRRGASAVVAYTDALAGLEELPELRAEIDANRATEAHGTIENGDAVRDFYARYTGLIRAFFDATDALAVTIDDVELRRGVELVNVASRQVEVYVVLSREMLLIGLLQEGADTGAEIMTLAAPAVSFQENNEALLLAGPPYDAVVDEHFPADFLVTYQGLIDRTFAGEVVPYDDLAVPFAEPDVGGFAELRRALSETTDEVADADVAAARSRERTVAALAVLVVVGALALILLVSRSITRPLRRLTVQAQEMARRRLPEAVAQVLRTPLGEDAVVPHVEPIAVHTNDEVGDVAGALGTVQDTALDLALEQALLRRNLADSFLNLGRRNQNLLGRQIDYITAFESTESDPEALGNLFRLDHLATRMRRNAESLLVLGGVEPPRTWSAPVPLLGVVRSAVGEVEDYERVVLREVQPAQVDGVVATDLAHLLAELLENALVFSAPDRPVEIYGSGRRDGSYSVAVSDSGPGMEPAQLAAANRRLAGEESFTVAPSRSLGHYVAGRLAARHGIRVQLGSGQRGVGILAVVDLPPAAVGPSAGGPPGREAGSRSLGAAEVG